MKGVCIARACVLRKRSCRVHVRGRRETKTRGINEEGTSLPRLDTENIHCRQNRPLFVLRGHKPLKGFVNTRVLVEEARRGESLGLTNLYARWIAASLLMEDAVFTFARVAVHNSNH
jgi:hypothetical protein